MRVSVSPIAAYLLAASSPSASPAPTPDPIPVETRTAEPLADVGSDRYGRPDKT